MIAEGDLVAQNSAPVDNPPTARIADYDVSSLVRFMESQPAKPDPRVALAAERTLLAWMRTGLSLMGFGFVVARFGLFLREFAAGQAVAGMGTGAFSRTMGVALVMLGVIVNAFAAVQHALTLSDASIVDRRRRVSGWVGVGMCAVMAVLGVTMAVYLLLMR
jgi:putative membrane protein